MTPIQFFFLLKVLFKTGSLPTTNTDFQWLISQGFITAGSSSGGDLFVITDMGAQFAMGAFAKLL